MKINFYIHSQYISTALQYTTQTAPKHTQNNRLVSEFYKNNVLHRTIFSMGYSNVTAPQIAMMQKKTTQPRKLQSNIVSCFMAHADIQLINKLRSKHWPNKQYKRRVNISRKKSFTKQDVNIMVGRGGKKALKQKKRKYDEELHAFEKMSVSDSD